MEAKIRINYTEREVEIEGSELFVREQLESFADTLEAFASNNDVQDEISENSGEHVVLDPNSQKASSKLPETFGEYLSRFSRDISQDEQILVSGYFVQSKSPDNAFSTKEANDLLKEQGTKVSNPAQSVINGKKAKRIFALQKGKFRISTDGIDHINTLHSG